MSDVERYLQDYRQAVKADQRFRGQLKDAQDVEIGLRRSQADNLRLAWEALDKMIAAVKSEAKEELKA